MPTFTFIADFEGGTYIYQGEAVDLRTACTLWKDDVRNGRYIQHLDAGDFTESFDFYIDELPPVAIDGMLNVWNFGFAVGERVLDVHIVQTDMNRAGEPLEDRSSPAQQTT